MKNFLRITLLMLFCMMAIPLSFGWQTTVEVRISAKATYHRVTAEAANPEQGKVYAQFAKPHFIQSVTVGNQGEGTVYACRYEHDIDDVVTPDISEYDTKVVQTNEYNANPDHVEIMPFLYAEPNPGYVFDYWEITCDNVTQTIDSETDEPIDPLHIISQDPNYSFLWSHLRLGGTDYVASFAQVSEIYAVAHFKKVAVEPSEPQEPANTKIQGYFRIQNVGNSNYVEVTGPFTARPDQNKEAAEKSAGTVMYVEAVQDGESYRLTHLRCQGIDVVAQEELNADDYTRVLSEIDLDLLNDENLFNTVAYGLVRQGFTYGYTNIARATVGTVFWIVASALEKYAEDASADGKYTFEKNDYIAVAEDFNREVTAKLDLGIRLKPVSFEDKTVQVYFDVPSLQAVCDWYNNDENATISTGANRHDVFASAMRAMSTFLGNRKINLETFNAHDIELFKSWQYDITEDYDTDDDGNVVLDFDRIFSDPVLLFNWIKMVGYYILNPSEDEGHGLAGLGFDGIGNAANQHYLTGMLISYLPRLHYNTRAFLINGRVGEDDKFGGEWDKSKDGTLGFAGNGEINIAGENGVWKLCPVDNKTEKFVVDHKYSVNKNGEEFGTSALYFDFPVSAVDPESTTFYTLSAQMYYTEIDGYKYTYNKVEDLDNYIEARTPFLIKTAEGGDSQLEVADGSCLFLAPSDASAAAMRRAPVAPYYLSDESESSLRGVLLPTSLTNDDLANLWGETAEVYPYSEIEGVDKSLHVGFTDKTVAALGANEAVYVPSLNSVTPPIKEEPEEAMKSLEESFVYIGEPEPTNPTGVQTVGSDVKLEKNVLYDLRGIRVEKPVPGNIYILNGQKVFIR